MTVKKRKSKISPCPQCGAFVPDQEKHLSSFNGINSHEIISSTFSAPFIFDQRLYTSRVVKIPIEIMKSYNGYFSDFILLNPEAMRLCGLILGSQCLLISYGGEGSKIVTVFADSETIAPFAVGLPLDFEFSGPLMIEAIGNRAQTATLIRIKNNSSYFRREESEFSDEIRQHVKSRLVGNYVIAGEVKSFWYFGETFTLEISDLAEKRPLDEISNTVVPSSISEKTIDSYGDFISACSELESTVDEMIPCSPSNGYLSDTVIANFEGFDQFAIQLTDLFPFFSKIVLINEKTVLTFDISEPKEDKLTDNKQIYLSHIGGMSKIANKMMEILNYFYSDSYGFVKCPGILISGPPGCGKTSLVAAVANHLKLNLFIFSAIEAYSDRSKFDKRIGDYFSRTCHVGNSLALIEDVDLLVPKKSDTDLQRTVKYSFLSRLDKIILASSVFVICTTSSLNCVDLSLRRRLECEMEIPTPNSNDRYEIFTACLSSFPSNCLYTTQHVSNTSDIACGYVAGDIASVCKLAYRTAIFSGRGDSVELDLLTALKSVKPSSMKELSLDVPKIRWTDIGGLDKVKEGIKQMVEWPIIHPQAFSRLGIKPPRGILMYGPPGCSKTMIAQAIATESHFNFLSVKGSELLSKYVGESERMVRELFSRARAASPTVVFFDEIDALAPSRGTHSVSDRVLAQLLTELDGVETLSQVVFIAATNRPDMIDQALLRPGRVDRLIYVSLPDEASRRKIFDLQLRPKPLARDVLVGELARYTEGYSGAEIVAVCQEAAMDALTENINAKCTEERHFMSALGKICPRTDEKMLEIYHNFSENNSFADVRLFDVEKKNLESTEIEGSNGAIVCAGVVGTVIGAAAYLLFKMI